MILGDILKVIDKYEHVEIWMQFIHEEPMACSRADKIKSKLLVSDFEKEVKRIETERDVYGVSFLKIFIK